MNILQNDFGSKFDGKLQQLTMVILNNYWYGN